MMFDQIEAIPADPLLGLIAAFAADKRTDKVDLGVGVYKNDDGQTPVMQAVKQAETRLVQTQPTKTYLGPNGSAEFVDLMADLTFGRARPHDGFLSGMQTPGGTAALRLAAEVIKHAKPDATVWLLDPTWANHQPIFEAAGLRTEKLPFLRQGDARPDMDALIAGLSNTQAGDAVVLHGSCHNPSGVEMTVDEWDALISVLEQRGTIPLVDQAYQGFGLSLDADSYAVGRVISNCTNCLVTVSCSKNFGLYRERTGALFMTSDVHGVADRARAAAGRAARGNYSMPPDHGAAVVAEILSNADLRQSWERELKQMRDRLFDLRQALANSHETLEGLSGGQGMFSLLPLSLEGVAILRDTHGIYTAPDGRINIAGLRADDVERVAAKLSSELSKV